MNVHALIGRHPPELPATPVAYASYLYCPFCGKTIHAHAPGDLRAPEDIADQAELFAIEHFRRFHPRRWWLYERTGWHWPIAGWLR